MQEITSDSASRVVLSDEETSYTFDLMSKAFFFLFFLSEDSFEAAYILETLLFLQVWFTSLAMSEAHSSTDGFSCYLRKKAKSQK